MSSRKFIVEGQGLPKWNNPISHAVVVNNMCFISGQLSVSAEGEYIAASIEGETHRAFENLFAVVKAAGFDRSDIVYIDIAFSDLSDINIVNEIYMRLFPEGKRPARTVYEAANLPFGGKIKVVATAVKDVM